MDIIINRSLYISCQAGPGFDVELSALKASTNMVEFHMS